jgi:hypothetical protein
MDSARLAVFETVLVHHIVGIAVMVGLSVAGNHECQHTLLPDGVDFVALVR